MGAESESKKKARANSEAIGLEGISLSIVEANLLHFFTDLAGAEKVVEIGTLTGLSALYVLENSKNVKLWTLEKSPEHTEKAKQVLQSYISEGRCELVLGDAKEKLNFIAQDSPFDLIFIDGNKAAYLDYFNWAVENLKPGGLALIDNIFLAGAVWGDQTLQKFNDKQIKVVNEMNQAAFNRPNLKSVVIPTEEGLLVCKKLF